MSDLSELWRAEMMSVEDIAALWKVPRDYALNVLVKQEGFPPVAPGSTRKFQRWLRSDVVAFIQGKAAAGDGRI
jgi:hypothetical protein